MSNKLKYIVFFGAIFGLLGFAHSYIQFDGWVISIRDKETPVFGGLIGWITLCTGLFYLAVDAMAGSVGKLWRFGDLRAIERGNRANTSFVMACCFTALLHAFLYIDAYWIESTVAALFFLVFYYFLGKAVDG